MAIEQEHRDQLKKAQQSAEFIEDFLATIQKSPRTQTSELLVGLIETAKIRAKTLESELDQIWDLFKRTSP
jgi:hypothetical protein